MVSRVRSIAILVAVAVWLGGSVSSPRAQTGDPVGLIASAAIVPFWAAGGYLTVFEVTSLGENPDMHGFIFTSTCNRAFSFPFRMSAHDAAIVSSEELGLNFDGLLALAKSTDNITATALDSAITLRAHRVNLLLDTIGQVDAIGAAHAEDPTRVWNPLRSGASTITFADNPPLSQTIWWFVCLRNDIVVDVGPGIPPLPPGANLIRMRIYDLDEHPAFDTQVQCQCLTQINPAHLLLQAFQESRYVEMVSSIGPPSPNAPSFVLYRSIRFHNGNFHEDVFGRAPGISAPSLLTGVPVVGAR